MNTRIEGYEVLAVPPLFLQESGHSGGIPVDSGIYTGMFRGMVFHGMDRNTVPRNGQEWNFTVCWYIIVYLFVTDNKQGLFGKHVYQTSPLSSSHHHHHHVRHHRPRSSSPPTVIVHDGLNPAHTGFHRPPRPPTLDNDTRASTSPDQNGNHRLVDCDTPPIRLGSTSAPQRSAATPECPCHQNGNQLLSTMTPAHSFGLTLHPNT